MRCCGAAKSMMCVEIKMHGMMECVMLSVIQGSEKMLWMGGGGPCSGPTYVYLLSLEGMGMLPQDICML